MQSNVIHMIMTVVGFLFANLIVMLSILYYRERKKKAFIKPSSLNAWLLHSNIAKLLFVFSSLYFVVYVVYSHTGIVCQDLDKVAQCQCYALEVVHHKPLEEKLDWAKKGLQMCPNSTFFSNFLLAHQIISLEAKLDRMLPNKKFSTPISIHLKDTQGATIKKGEMSCLQMEDSLVEGEHFASVSDFQLQQGLNYFVFEAIPTHTALYIYIIGEKSSILFPWVDVMGGAPNWIVSGDTTSLKPILSHLRSAEKRDKFTLVLDSSESQKIQVRWQHGEGGSTIYHGLKRNISNICKVEYGQITDK